MRIFALSSYFGTAKYVCSKTPLPVISFAARQNSVYVTPDDFKVTAEGTAKHGVTQAFVEEHGLPSTDALNIFLACAREAFTRGARLLAHQIEFDAGVIAAELQRCGLHEESQFWHRAVQGGICTMDPSLCNWIRDVSGDVDAKGRSCTGPLERLQAFHGSRQC